MVLVKERIGRMLEYLKEQIYPEKMALSHYRMMKADQRLMDVKNVDTSNWEDFFAAQLWGGHRERYYFATVAVIPESFDGNPVVYELITGREGEWDATNPQFTLYVNGHLVQGLDVNHREVLLSESAHAGDHYEILLSAFTGDNNFQLRLDSCLKILDRRTERYYYDLSVPYQTACLLGEEDDDRITILRALDDSLNQLDMRIEGSDAYYTSLERAQDWLTREFYEKFGNPEGEPVVCCVGHTHIDCAWLWTLKVTEDKAVRSFSTVLNLMNEYPEYVFMSSQPQLYKYVKKNAPEVYEGIKARVAEGRWEPEGGMFVEADCNLASGEALVRQFLYGKRFFKREFGKDNVILWLPDVFGYSAALPQIMKNCGIKYFMTTKISWNEFNKMPNDTFLWEGIDGSRILTHFIPTRDYQKVDEGGEKSFVTTYNGFLNPLQMRGAWQRYSQKDLNKEVLCSFGYGDGGGGPTKEMLENQRRMAQGIPGCPRTKMSRVLDFFKTLDAHTRDKTELPVWVGELYLEYHRGTYTTMARNKKYNRRSELAFQNAETFAMMDKRLTGAPYPKEALAAGWEVILRNQFHDILPGSSILEVYQDSKKEYEGIGESVRQLTSGSLDSLVSRIAAPRGAVVVFNANSQSAEGVVAFSLPIGQPEPTLYDDGKCVPLQKTEAGEWIFIARDLPSKGYRTYQLSGSEMGAGKALTEPSFAKKINMKIDSRRIENDFFVLELNEKAQFSRIYDKKAGRELLPEGERGNVIVSYEDRPHNYDAWDLNNYYTEKSWEIDDVQSVRVIENGPVRAGLRIERAYLRSSIVQEIYLYADVPQIDIKNIIDWKEHQIFLKDYFPLDVHSNEATFDIQYGNVKRATHANTSWDFARFELCHHKWLDVAEEGYGVSFLNDCKYGVSVDGAKVGLSMLKSSVSPNPEADKERHEFTYSLYPHSGDWREADTAARAYRLSNPPCACVKTNDGGELDERYEFLSVNQDNVIIETAKMAEDSEALIVRLYEFWNRRCTVRLSSAETIKAVCECDMMEENDRPLEHDAGSVEFEIKPYEIKTLKIQF